MLMLDFEFARIQIQARVAQASRVLYRVKREGLEAEVNFS